MASFETVVVNAGGSMNDDGPVKGLIFEGINGTKYGPYGYLSLYTGKLWETDIPLGCSLQYVSGKAGALLDTISFHYNCPPTDLFLLNTATTEGMNRILMRIFILLIHVMLAVIYIRMYVSTFFVSYLQCLTIVIVFELIYI